MAFLTPFTFTTTTGGTSEKEGGVVSVTPTAAAPCVAIAAIDPVRAVARSSRTRLVRVFERGER